MSYSNTPVQKGWLTRITRDELDAHFVFQFNPTNTSHQVTPEYAFINPPGSPAPTAQFRFVNSDELSLDLLLDAVETFSVNEEGITAQRSFLESIARPDLDQYLKSTGQFISPPRVLYGMGLDSWECVVTSYACRTTRWNREGTPTRARVSLLLKSLFVGFAATQRRYQDLREYRDLAELK